MNRVNQHLPFYLISLALLFVPVLGFGDDSYEQNDSRGGAHNLSGHEGEWLNDISGLAEMEDHDWYRVHIPPRSYDDLLVVECEFEHEEGNIDIELTDDTGAVVASSSSNTDNEHFSSTVDWDTSYYIHVYAPFSFTTQEYDLFFDRLNPPVADLYESNDGQSEAWYAGKNWQDQWLSDKRGLPILEYQDWYEIDVTGDFLGLPFRRVLVLMEYDREPRKMQFRLHNAAGEEIARSIHYGLRNTDNAYIDFVVPSGGKYYIFAPEGVGDPQPYDLWWTDTLSSVDDDAYEFHRNGYNNGRARAWYPGDTGVEHDWENTPLSNLLGLGQQSNDDWYEIDVTRVPEPTRVVAAALFSEGEGNITIGLYNEAGRLRLLSVTPGDNAYLDYQSAERGTYYIRVFGDDAGNDYDLWWGDYGVLADDHYESNDTLDSAYDPGYTDPPYTWLRRWLTTVDGIGFQKDDDWYEILLEPGAGRVLAECKFNHGDGNIDLGLYDKDGNLIVEAATDSDDEVLDYTVPTTSTGSNRHYLKVSGDDAGNIYDLWWHREQDDSYEHNNRRADAFSLRTRERTWLTDLHGWGVAANDDDWFEIFVNEDFQQVVVDLDFRKADSSLDLELYDSDGAVLARWGASAEFGGKQVVVVPDAGTYFIRVLEGDPSSETLYDLWWDDQRSRATHQFDASRDGWTWFDLASKYQVPAHGRNDSAGTLEMTETAGDRIVFGSWESPREPLLAVQPVRGRVYGARFFLASSVNGASCPGFRLRAVTAHMVKDSRGEWVVDFTHPDLNASHEVQVSTTDMFHVDGREPGTGGWLYTLLMFPEQTGSLEDPDVSTFFACDLLDLDTFDRDAGTLSIERVDIASFRPPPPGDGTRIPELSFHDAPGANDFRAWMPDVSPLDEAKFDPRGLRAGVDPTSISISMSNDSAWFVSSIVSPGTPLTPGAYYRARFNIGVTGTEGLDYTPVIRTGFVSDRLVYAVDRELPAKDKPTAGGFPSRTFEVWMVAPSELSGGQTEPIGLRLMTYRPENNTGFPFFRDVSGTIRCDEVVTEMLPPPRVIR